MFSLYTLVVLVCALLELRVKARAKARDDLRKLVYAHYSTKSGLKKQKKRVKKILSQCGLLLEFARHFAEDEEICRSAIKQNPYALQFVPCRWDHSKTLLRKMTKLAWKVAEERGLDVKPLLSYSVNVPVVFNFITETIKSGAFGSISVPEWYSNCSKGQLMLARYCPEEISYRVELSEEALRCLIFSHPFSFPMRLIGEDHVNMLVELIKHRGVCVLMPFLLHTYEHLANSLEEERVVDTYISIVDEDYEFKNSFPFNNRKVFEAVFRINPWTALNYFERELWDEKKSLFEQFLNVNARDALKFFNHYIYSLSKEESFAVWRKAVLKDRAAALEVNPHELAHFWLWHRLGTDLSREVLEYLS